MATLLAFAFLAIACVSHYDVAQAQALAPAPAKAIPIPAPHPGITHAPTPSPKTPSTAMPPSMPMSPPSTATPPLSASKPASGPASGPAPAPANAKPTFVYVPFNETIIISPNFTQQYANKSITLQVGDQIVFNATVLTDIWLLPNQTAFDNCDFSNATFVTNLTNTSGPSVSNPFPAPGMFYFAAKTPFISTGGSSNMTNMTVTNSTKTGCDEGAKLAVKVQPAPTIAPTPAPPASGAPINALHFGGVSGILLSMLAVVLSILV